MTTGSTGSTGDALWSWADLLTPQDQPTPADAAMGLFSPTHLTVVVLLSVGVVALMLTYRAADAPRRGLLRRAVGWSVLGLEVVRQLAYVVLGYTPEILPLHACSLAVFSIFIDSRHPNRWTGSVLYALGWWGALAAVVFPDWASRPFLNVFTWQSFLIHALIVGYVLMRLAAGEMLPEVRDLWKAGVLITGFATVAFAANVRWGTNFWFLNTGAPGSPLEGIQALAGPLYVPALLLGLAAVWTLLYLPWLRRTTPQPQVR